MTEIQNGMHMMNKGMMMGMQGKEMKGNMDKKQKCPQGMGKDKDAMPHCGMSMDDRMEMMENRMGMMQMMMKQMVEHDSMSRMEQMHKGKK